MASRHTVDRPLFGDFQHLIIIAAIVATFLVGMALGYVVRTGSTSDSSADGASSVTAGKPVAAPVPAQAGEGIIQAQQEGVSASLANDAIVAHTPVLAGEGILQAQQEGIVLRGPAALDNDRVVAHTPEMAGQGILQAQMEGVTAAPLPLDSFAAKLQREQKLYEANGQQYPPASVTTAPAVQSKFADPRFLEENLYLPTSVTTPATRGDDWQVEMQKLYALNTELYPAPAVTAAPAVQSEFTDPLFMEENLYLPGTTTTPAKPSGGWRVEIR